MMETKVTSESDSLMETQATNTLSTASRLNPTVSTNLQKAEPIAITAPRLKEPTAKAIIPKRKSRYSGFGEVNPWYPGFREVIPSTSRGSQKTKDVNLTENIQVVTSAQLGFKTETQKKVDGSVCISSQINVNVGTDSESTSVSFSEAVQLPKKPDEHRSNVKKKYPGFEEVSNVKERNKQNKYWITGFGIVSGGHGKKMKKKYPGFGEVPWDASLRKCVTKPEASPESPKLQTSTKSFNRDIGVNLRESKAMSKTYHFPFKVPNIPTVQGNGTRNKCARTTKQKYSGLGDKAALTSSKPEDSVPKKPRPVADKLYKCGECDVSIATSKDLSEHVKDIHNKFRCTNCGKWLEKKDALERHVNVEHSEKGTSRRDPSRIVPKKPTVNQEKTMDSTENTFVPTKLVCYVCGKAVNSFSELKPHVFIHVVLDETSEKVMKENLYGLEEL